MKQVRETKKITLGSRALMPGERRFLTDEDFCSQGTESSQSFDKDNFGPTFSAKEMRLIIKLASNQTRRPFSKDGRRNVPEALTKNDISKA